MVLGGQTLDLVVGPETVTVAPGRPQKYDFSSRGPQKDRRKDREEGKRRPITGTGPIWVWERVLCRCL